MSINLSRSMGRKGEHPMQLPYPRPFPHAPGNLHGRREVSQVHVAGGLCRAARVQVAGHPAAAALHQRTQILNVVPGEVGVGRGYGSGAEWRNGTASG